MATLPDGFVIDDQSSPTAPEDDASSWGNVALRAIAKPADWATGGYNAAAQIGENLGAWGSGHQIPSASEYFNLPARPENEDWRKGLAEDYGPLAAVVLAPAAIAAAPEIAAGSVGAGLLTGLGTAATMGTRALASTIAGHYGEAALQGLGESIDPEHPEKWGKPLGWIGGTAASAGPGLAEWSLRNYYARQGAAVTPGANKNVNKQTMESWENLKQKFEDQGLPAPPAMKEELPPSQWLMEGEAKTFGRSPIQEKDLAGKLADLAVAERRELPEVTPGNQQVVQAAETARAQSGLTPSAMGDARPAIENFLGNTFHNDPINITGTMNTLQNLADPARAARSGVAPVSTDPADVIGAQNLIKRLQVMGAQQVPGSNDWYAPFKNFRGWRSAIGAKIGDDVGLGGGDGYHATYGAANSDLMNAASHYNVDPESVRAAFAIERGQYGAQDLKNALQAGHVADPLTVQKYPMTSLARVIDRVGTDSPDYEKMFGGKFQQAGAPAKGGPGATNPGGAADVRGTVADIDTLARAAGPPTAMQGGIIHKLIGYAPALTGLAYGGLENIAHALAAAGGVEAIKEAIPETVMESPAVKNALIAGRKWVAPPLHTLTFPAAEGYPKNPPDEGVIAKQPMGAPSTYDPRAPIGPGISILGPGGSRQMGAPSRYNPRSPRSNQPLSSLPTTRPILNAWNAANVGYPRSATG